MNITTTGLLCAALLSASIGLVGCSGDKDVSFSGASGAGEAVGGDTGTGGEDTPDTPVGDMVCAADAPATSAQEIADVITQSTGIDGVAIDVHMSVFVPALARGECAPVIVKSHGFGGSRLTSLSDVADDDNASNVATRDAWRTGYFVITFDQRGFGQTGGAVQVEDPDYEGHDITAVLDYAEKSLGEHLAYRGGDPVVGALGLSYGGGFQLVGAGVDPRFDALVPAATWYALPYSLDPNGVPKTVWLDLLVALGASGANGNLAPFIYNGFLQAQTTGQVSDDVVDELRGHGLNAFCDGLRPDGAGVPHVDVFLVQGVNDTLFNMNEAVANAACLRATGNDVRVLIQRTGHILPLFQDVPGAFGFDLDPVVTCGARAYTTSQRMLDFLDEKLRGRAASPEIDQNCIVQDDTHGIVSNEFPIGGVDYAFDAQTMTTGPVVETAVSVLQGIANDGALLNTVAGSLGMTVTNLAQAIGDLAADPTDVEGLLTDDVLKVLPPALLQRLTSPARETPLLVADRAMTLAGIPIAALQLTALDDAPAPIVFVGLGVKRSGSDQVSLLNDQIAPLRGAGEHDQQLVGVSTRLEQGDTLYLLTYGFHYQYYASFNRVPQVVRLAGRVALPLTNG